MTNVNITYYPLGRRENAAPKLCKPGDFQKIIMIQVNLCIHFREAVKQQIIFHVYLRAQKWS